MAEVEDIQSWIGADVVDRDDAKLGKLEDVLVDLASGNSTYGITKSGLITRRSIVPLAGAAFSRGHVRVAVTAEQVSTAPVDATGRLTEPDHALLARHYGTDPGSPTGQQPADDGGVRFESATVLAERQRAAAADLRRAEELEAEAAARHEKSGSLRRDAIQREAEASDVEADRDRLLAEAAEARAQAEGRRP